MTTATPSAGAKPVGAPVGWPDGFHPFWFWNGRITREAVRDQIARMSEQGIRGFFIHSRQGLQQPYMSSSYLDLVEFALDEGRAHEMSVHLYDEYPYPSGAAGGGVVQSDPALGGTVLQVNHWALDGGPVRVELPAGRVLACRAYAVRDGGTDWEHWTDLSGSVGMVLTKESYHDAGVQAYNDRRFFADAPLPVLETTLTGDRFELWAVSIVPISGHKYWGSFPDVTNPRAVRRFLDLTHERYRRHLGPKLATVASIFVDEVEPVASASVVAELERRHGKDVAEVLVAFSAPTHPLHTKALREMQEVRLEMFEDSFERQISSWCRDNGVRYAGEKPSLRLSQLAWMDVPGCEPGHTKAGAPCSDLLQADIRGNAKATASAAYFYGKEGSLCECYHSLGWGATLQDAKLIAESLLLLGTRWLVPHAFFYSLDGLRKHDAPPSFFHMPYWRLFGQLSRRVSAIAEAFEGSWLDASTGVLEPAGGLPDARQLACYEKLQHSLLRAHVDFLTVDLPILTSGHLLDGRVQLRDVGLRALVLPPMREAEPGLEEWLAAFERVGGQVVRVVGRGQVDEAVSRLIKLCPPSLSVTALSGDAASVMMACRRSERGRIWLLINTSPEPAELLLFSREHEGLSSVSLESSWARRLVERDGLSEVRLEGFESVLIRGSPAVDSGPRKPSGGGQTTPATVRVQTDGLWYLRPSGKNVLRLGQWLMSLPGQHGTTAVVEPAPIANQLLRSRLPFVPRIDDRFGSSPAVGFPELLVRYETSFACHCGGDLQLVMQPEAIVGEWRIWFDDLDAFGPEVFTTACGPMEGCIGHELTSVGKAAGPEGSLHRHLVKIEVYVHDGAAGLRDGLYVAGDFGVFAPPADALASSLPCASNEMAPLLATLAPRPEMGELGAWEPNGLPYYAGELEYSRLLPLLVREESDEVEVELAVPQGCEDALEIAFGTGPFRPLPWSPRRLLVPRSELAAAEKATAVRIHVLSTLERTFEGRRFDTDAHAYRNLLLTPVPTRQRKAKEIRATTQTVHER